MNELVKASPAALPMAKAAQARDPDTNTAMMLSSLRQCGVEVVVKHKTIFSSDSTGESTGWRDVIEGAQVTVSETANEARASEIVAAASAPARDEDMELWLSELGLVTAKRNMGDATAELFLVAYTKRLAAYPADIVRTTIQGWSGKWFPTWGELKDVLDARSAERGAIMTALSVHAATKARKGAPRPAYVAEMSPDDRVEWLLFQARICRRSDPERAQELEDEADRTREESRKLARQRAELEKQGN
jgi:hypothetical protein